MRLIDADAVKLPKGFFEEVDNVPKFYEWLNKLPTIEPPMTSGYVTTSTDEPPVVYAEQKYGKWFNTTTDIPNLLMNVCSECGFQYPSAIRPRFNYCPNCGSFMGEKDDET